MLPFRVNVEKMSLLSYIAVKVLQSLLESSKSHFINKTSHLSPNAASCGCDLGLITFMHSPLQQVAVSSTS